MLPKDMIDVANIGIHPNNSAQANTDAALAAQQALPPKTSQRWFFGGADLEHPYRFANTFHIIRPIWLEGIAGSFHHPATVFQFPPGKHGLYFHFVATHEGNLNDNAHGGAATNIRIEGGGRTGTPIAHGVVLKATCFLSHLLIENFRGDGIHSLASLPASSASLFRLDTVSASNNGDSISVKVADGAPMMTRSGRFLTVTTAGNHGLQPDDIFWLESDSPDRNFPRGACSVTQVVSAETFICLHELDLTGNATASGDYRIVVGNGIYTHGDDANAGNCFACDFRNNAAWGCSRIRFWETRTLDAILP